MSWFRKKEEVAPPLPASLASSESYSVPVAAGPSAAVQQMTDNFVAYTEQLNAISTVCWEKCVTKKNQPELSIGETACIDRCVLKHLATSTKVAEVFAVHMQQGQAAQAPPQ